MGSQIDDSPHAMGIDHIVFLCVLLNITAQLLIDITRFALQRIFEQIIFSINASRQIRGHKKDYHADC